MTEVPRNSPILVRHRNIYQSPLPPTTAAAAGLVFISINSLTKVSKLLKMLRY